MTDGFHARAVTTDRPEHLKGERLAAERTETDPMGEPLGDISSPSTSTQTLVLGMPHLCLGGLSETWLLKELGHRHWLMLAAAAGKKCPDFRDVEGNTVYAAFTCVSIEAALFGELSEHDALMISSTLARVSRTQFSSVHSLTVGALCVGRVELTSVFVKRMVAHLNRSVTRVAVENGPPLTPGAPSAFATAAAAIRKGQWSEHWGFVRAEAKDLGRLLIDPCPSQDFNGAEFLYFAAFQTFVDRAEWAYLRTQNAAPRRLGTTHRDIIYNGNIEPGERLDVTIQAVRRDAQSLTHWSRIEREDGALLAEVFTARTFA